MPGKHYDDIRHTYLTAAKDPNDKQIGRMFDDPNTRRMLIDTRQVETFIAIGERPPKDLAKFARLPFKQFFVELDQPINVEDSEPGHEDRLIGLLFSESLLEKGSNLRKVISASYPRVDLVQVIAFLKGGGDFITQGFLLDRNTGVGFTSADNCVGSDFVTNAGGPAMVYAEQASSGQLLYVPAGEGPGTRTVGWWEGVVRSRAALAQWMLMYMSAKGVVIVPEDISRQQRRWNERNPEKAPEPWHVIKVDPTIQYAVPREGEGSGVSYRFDVQGHFRLQTIWRGPRRGDDPEGRVKEQRLQWIPPHQRGLRHTEYIPATRYYKGGRGGLSPSDEEE